MVAVGDLRGDVRHGPRLWNKRDICRQACRPDRPPLDHHRRGDHHGNGPVSDAPDPGALAVLPDLRCFRRAGRRLDGRRGLQLLRGEVVRPAARPCHRHRLSRRGRRNDGDGTPGRLRRQGLRLADGLRRHRGVCPDHRGRAIAVADGEDQTRRLRPEAGRGKRGEERSCLQSRSFRCSACPPLTPAGPPGLPVLDHGRLLQPCRDGGDVDHGPPGRLCPGSTDRQGGRGVLPGVDRHGQHRRAVFLRVAVRPDQRCEICIGARFFLHGGRHVSPYENEPQSQRYSSLPSCSGSATARLRR